MLLSDYLQLNFLQQYYMIGPQIQTCHFPCNPKKKQSNQKTQQSNLLSQPLGRANNREKEGILNKTNHILILNKIQSYSELKSTFLEWYVQILYFRRIKNMTMECRFLSVKIYAPGLAPIVKKMAIRFINDKWEDSHKTKKKNNHLKINCEKNIIENLTLITDGTHYFDNLCFDFNFIEMPEKIFDLIMTNAFQDFKIQRESQSNIKLKTETDAFERRCFEKDKSDEKEEKLNYFEELLWKCKRQYSNLKEAKISLEQSRTKQEFYYTLIGILRAEILSNFHKYITIPQSLMSRLEEEKKRKKDFSIHWKNISEESRKRILYLDQNSIAELSEYLLKRFQIKMRFQDLEREIEEFLRLQKNQFCNKIFKCKLKKCISFPNTVEYYQVIYKFWKEQVEMEKARKRKEKGKNNMNMTANSNFHRKNLESEIKIEKFQRKNQSNKCEENKIYFSQKQSYQKEYLSFNQRQENYEYIRSIRGMEEREQHVKFHFEKNQSKSNETEDFLGEDEKIKRSVKYKNFQNEAHRRHNKSTSLESNETNATQNTKSREKRPKQSYQKTEEKGDEKQGMNEESEEKDEWTIVSGKKNKHKHPSKHQNNCKYEDKQMHTSRFQKNKGSIKSNETFSQRNQLHQSKFIESCKKQTSNQTSNQRALENDPKGKIIQTDCKQDKRQFKQSSNQSKQTSINKICEESKKMVFIKKPMMKHTEDLDENSKIRVKSIEQKELTELEKERISEEVAYLKLNEELQQFSDLISQEANQFHQRRVTAFERIQYLLHLYSIDIKLFGSCANGIAIKNSDIDIAVGCNILQHFQYIANESEKVKFALAKIEEILCQHRWVKNLKLIKTASIPVIKLTVDTSIEFNLSMFQYPAGLNTVHDSGEIDIDITIETTRTKAVSEYEANLNHYDNMLFAQEITHLGIISTNAINNWLSEVKSLHSIVVVMKMYLSTNQLNITYEGGLNTYAMIVLLLAVIFEKGLQNQTNPAKVLQIILKFYTEEFDQQNYGINILYRPQLKSKDSKQKDQNITKQSVFYKKESKGEYADLQILDPLNNNKNITKNCYYFKEIKQLFRNINKFCFEKSVIESKAFIEKLTQDKVVIQKMKSEELLLKFKAWSTPTNQITGKAKAVVGKQGNTFLNHHQILLQEIAENPVNRS